MARIIWLINQFIKLDASVTLTGTMYYRSISDPPELAGVCAAVEGAAAYTAGRHTEQAGHAALGAHLQAAGTPNLDRVPPTGW